MTNLLLNGNVIVSCAPHIEFGIFENEPKWGLFDRIDESSRKAYYYIIDPGSYHYDEKEGYVGLAYETIEVEGIPEDYDEGKYLFEDGKFVLNMDWHPPLPSAEDRLDEIEKKLSDLDTEGEDVWDEMAKAIEEGVNDV